MNELTINSTNLPTTIEDLSKFVLIGREKLVAVRAEIRAIDKVGLAEEVRRQKLEEAQAISEAVLDAEVKIGELMRAVPKATNGGAKTEYEKRKFAIDHNGEYPFLTMQGYFDRNNNVISLAIAKTVDVMSCVENNIGYYRHTGQNKTGQAEFYVVPWDKMKQAGYKVLIYERQ